MTSEEKSICLNYLFDTVLQRFRAAQEDNALTIPLTLGNVTKAVNLKVPLALINGDIQGGDNICGRFAYYNNDTRRICKMCNATPKVYDSKDIDCCQLLVMEEMKQLCINGDNTKLHSLMQFRNWKAFFVNDYGGLPGGVFTAACPPEVLHSLENGLMFHCLRELFAHVIAKSTKKDLVKLFSNGYYTQTSII